MNTARLSFLLLGTVALLAPASGASAATLYVENFAQASGTGSLADYGWNLNYGTAGIAADAADTSKGYAVAANPGALGDNGYASLSTTSAGSVLAVGAPFLLWTGTGSFGSIDTLGSITFYLKDSSTSEHLHVALEIGGSWYVTNNAFDSNAFSLLTMTPSATTWNNLSLMPGTMLALAGTASLPTTGAVQGIGFFDAGQVNAIRIDNITVNASAVPEPGAGVLAAMAGLLCLAVRGARQAAA